MICNALHENCELYDFTKVDTVYTILNAKLILQNLWQCIVGLSSTPEYMQCCQKNMFFEKAFVPGTGTLGWCHCIWN